MGVGHALRCVVLKCMTQWWRNLDGEVWRNIDLAEEGVKDVEVADSINED